MCNIKNPKRWPLCTAFSNSFSFMYFHEEKMRHEMIALWLFFTETHFYGILKIFSILWMKNTDTQLQIKRDQSEENDCLPPSLTVGQPILLIQEFGIISYLTNVWAPHSFKIKQVNISIHMHIFTTYRCIRYIIYSPTW